ncbi:MAG TPA: hypothetical protein VHI32_04430 [Burkholderiales bacterium]|nr:hypothetical protein [Burkholderiales bacterium]
MGKPDSPYAWRTWTFRWNARRGTHILCVRATDSEGNMQPMEQQWNFGGYGNNSGQRVTVVVE